MNNANQTLAGSYAHSNASTVDLELRLGCGTREPQMSAFGGYLCSYCNKSFTSLQARGGHQTAHRKEMEELRRQLGANLENSGRHVAPPSKGKSARRPDLNPEKSIWKPLHVAGENGDGDKMGVKLQSTELKAPAESSGVNTADEVKVQMELDLSLHL